MDSDPRPAQNYSDGSDRESEPFYVEMEMTSKDAGDGVDSAALPWEPTDVMPGATPQVVGPNSLPTNGRFDTSTEPYAAGYPKTEIMSWSVREAKRHRDARKSA